MASGTRSGGVPGRGDTGGSRGVENAQGPDPDIRRLSAPSIEALARALKDVSKDERAVKPMQVALGNLVKSNHNISTNRVLVELCLRLLIHV